MTITGATATNNLVQGNFIGTDITGRLPLGNEIDGVLITQGASSNSIGGTVTGAGNTIAFNLDNGVDVVGVTTTGNSILSNLIFGNGLLGIDLGDDGVTLNHATATPGPNNFQNFPVITSVVSSGTSPIIGGTLNSVANTSFLVQFYSNAVATASGYGQGNTLLGSATVITDASGSATFNATVAGSLSLGSLVSATATNLSTGDTSEFSLDFAYQLTTEFSAATYTVSETGGTATITVTRSSGSSTSDVNYATGGGTAVAGVNYTPTSGTLVFSPGQTSQSFTIPVIHDFQITGPLTVGIALSSPTAGFLGTPSTAVLTINDVDTSGCARVRQLDDDRQPGSDGRQRDGPPRRGCRGDGLGGLRHQRGHRRRRHRLHVGFGRRDLQPRRHQRDDRGSDPEQYRGEQQDVLRGPEQPHRRRDPGDPGHGDDHDRAAERSRPTARRDQHQRLGTGVAPPGDPRRRRNSSGRNDIQFAIPASTAPLLNIPVPGFDPTTQTWTINLASPLPPITNQVDIDGYSQAHFPVPFRYPSAISSAVQAINTSAADRRHLHAHDGGPASGRDHAPDPVQRLARPRSRTTSMRFSARKQCIRDRQLWPADSSSHSRDSTPTRRFRISSRPPRIPDRESMGSPATVSHDRRRRRRARRPDSDLVRPQLGQRARWQ